MLQGLVATPCLHGGWIEDCGYVKIFLFDRNFINKKDYSGRIKKEYKLF